MENSDDQFSLKWNNFQSNLATGFHDLLQEEDMVDVTLAAEGKFLQAHKIILSVCSPYFKDLFKVNPCKHPIVILKDVGHQELTDMLDFMYRGEASVRQEDLAAFLKLAETLKVKGLAGDNKSTDDSVSASSHRKQSIVAKKKVKIVETSAFDSEDDPGDPEFTPAGGGGEPKRKRKRLSSPTTKTETISASATNNYVPLANPKQEIQEHEDVEFLDESTNDPLVQFITGKKQDDDGADGFEDSNLDAGDETHDGDLDMTAGPSNADDSTDQVPQGVQINYSQPTQILALEPTTIIAHQTKGPPPSPIWDYFIRDTERKVAVCRNCGADIRIGAGTTTGIVYHLKANHLAEYEMYKLQKQDWEKLKDFYVYQTYMKNMAKKQKKVVKVVQMSDCTSAIIVEPS